MTTPEQKGSPPPPPAPSQSFGWLEMAKIGMRFTPAQSRLELSRVLIEWGGQLRRDALAELGQAETEPPNTYTTDGEERR